MRSQGTQTGGGGGKVSGDGRGRGRAGGKGGKRGRFVEGFKLQRNERARGWAGAGGDQVLQGREIRGGQAVGRHRRGSPGSSGESGPAEGGAGTRAPRPRSEPEPEHSALPGGRSDSPAAKADHARPSLEPRQEITAKSLLPIHERQPR